MSLDQLHALVLEQSQIGHLVVLVASPLSSCRFGERHLKLLHSNPHRMPRRFHFLRVEDEVRALRDIVRIQDGEITKILKAVLERQARMWIRLDKQDERIARLAKDNAA